VSQENVFEILSEHRCFGGVQGFYRHRSREVGLPMRFSVYQPPAARKGPVPVLYYLAGLTCTEETFMVKAGAQRVAAELGLMLVAPDVSPRDSGTPGETEDWELGVGAGFYVDATVAPWARHYRMDSYVSRELPEVVAARFPARMDAQGLFGHSMGGHGALTLALKHPGQYRSLSAFAPICSPMRCPWGEKAFTHYLGAERSAWRAHDASELVRERPFGRPILVDQGLSDRFLSTQLHPEVFEAACQEAGQPLTLRRHEGYDHGYYFISTFIEEHLRFHAGHLLG
jgi:S-formylglutathione hydrolase